LIYIINLFTILMLFNKKFLVLLYFLLDISSLFIV